MRLIDADVFKMEDFHHCLDCDSIIQVLKHAPTIEAEPVRHGRWIQIEGFTACSECGASPADWEAKPNNPMGLPPFCHCCGAKMDGGGGDAGEGA